MDIAAHYVLDIVGQGTVEVREEAMLASDRERRAVHVELEVHRLRGVPRLARLAKRAAHHEHHEDQRHDFGHGPALEPVAHRANEAHVHDYLQTYEEYFALTAGSDDRFRALTQRLAQHTAEIAELSSSLMEANERAIETSIAALENERLPMDQRLTALAPAEVLVWAMRSDGRS